MRCVSAGMAASTVSANSEFSTHASSVDSASLPANPSENRIDEQSQLELENIINDLYRERVDKICSDQTNTASLEYSSHIICLFLAGKFKRAGGGADGGFSGLNGSIRPKCLVCAHT